MFRNYFCAIFVFSALCAPLFGQGSALLSGTVVDRRAIPIGGVKIVIHDNLHGLVRETTADSDGIYLFENLPSGEYSLEATKEGYRKLTIPHVAVTARQVSTLQIELVSATAEATDTAQVERRAPIQADPSAGLSFTKDFADLLLLNGRILPSLTQLSPGVLTVPDLYSHGVPSTMNYFTVDGASANIGLNPKGVSPGHPVSIGAHSGATAAGTSTNMISLDAVDEFIIQTFSSAQAFGRTPGAQIAIASRRGSNQWHGSAFEYFRNDRLNANDWFANAAGLSRPKASQNNFGATLGGPVIGNRTYFFGSYEGLRLNTPATAVATVPTLATRQNAVATLRPYLNAFPIANGPETGQGAALFTAAYSNPSRTNFGSFRIDHSFSDRVKFFARYAYSPSSGTARQNGFETPNSVISAKVLTQTLTAGVSWLRTASAQHDFRVNWTGVKASSSSSMDNFGGAVPLSTGGAFSLSVYGLAGYSFGRQVNDRQGQLNISDSISKAVGHHEYRIGFDFRKLTPTFSLPTYSQTFSFNGLSSLLSGNASSAVVSSSGGSVAVELANYSLYAQDTWKANERTTLVYGLRWDVNPAPSVRSGPNPITWNDDGTLTQSRTLYPTRLNNISPRLGLAYQMDTAPGREMMFRMGVGMFYDMAYGTTTGSFTTVPYIANRLLTLPVFPLTAANSAALAFPAVAPYSQVDTTSRSLEAPRVFQWNLSIERAFGPSQSFTIGYAGTKATRLLTRSITGFFSKDEYDIARITANGARSSYHALETQYRRRFSKSFQAQASYTYSHAIDTTSPGFPGDGFSILYNERRASSSFDARHIANVSGTWNLPVPDAGSFRIILRDWSVQGMVAFRTALPLNIQTITPVTSETSKKDSTNNPMGFLTLIYPNYTGQPVYISDPNAPGGRRLNSAAFAQPTSYVQGTLGPNAVRGFRLLQADVSLRRQIPLGERWNAQFSVEGFNILNNPNFANPLAAGNANLASGTFGIASTMLNQGSGSAVNSLYQNGGPRSLQLALRLQF